MEAPKHTELIYEILRRGQFISSNSPDETSRQLYNILDDEENFDFLYDYFRVIKRTLEKGNGYYYFSRIEKKADLERKIEQAFKWIDIVDFLKTYDNSFGPGSRFSPAEIETQIKMNPELSLKFKEIKKYAPGKEKTNEVIDKILTELRQDKFIDIENEITREYKVLSAFDYLEQLILRITISEEAENEIPE